MQAPRSRAVFNAGKKRRRREAIRSNYLPVSNAQEPGLDDVRNIFVSALDEFQLEPTQDLKAFSVNSTRRGPRRTSCAADSDRHLAYLQNARQYLHQLDDAALAHAVDFEAALNNASITYESIRHGYLCNGHTELDNLKNDHTELQRYYDDIRAAVVVAAWQLPAEGKPERFTPDKCSNCPILDTDNSQLFTITMIGKGDQPTMCRGCLAKFLFGERALCVNVKKMVKRIHDGIEALKPKCRVVSVHKFSKHHLELGTIEQSIATRSAGYGQCDNPIKFRVKFDDVALRPTSYYPSQLLLVDESTDEEYSLPSWYSELLVSGNKFWFGYTREEATDAGFNADPDVDSDKQHITHCDCLRQRIEYR